MLKKYCRRIVLALFLFGVPYAVLELILVERNFRLSMIGQGILMVLQGKSWSHMWYLYLILILYLITPALKWLLARLPKACVYVVLAVLLVGSSILPFFNKLLEVNLPMLPDGGIYFFYYICGYLFACEKVREQEKGEQGQCGRKQLGAGLQNKGMQNVIATISIIIVFVGMVLSRVLGGFSLQMAYNYPFTVLVSVLTFGVARRWKMEQGQKMAGWQRVSALCFTIYLVHPVFVNVLYKLLHISILDFPIGFSLPLFFVVILLLSAIAAWILCKIPVLKKYVL